MALKKSVVNKPTLIDDEAAESIVAENVAADVAEDAEVEAIEAAASEADAGEGPVEAVETSATPAVRDSREVAVAQSPNRRSLSTASNTFVDQAAEQGMDGLEIGYGSFPTVKLDDGEFVDGDGNSYESPFFFRPVSSRGVYAYSQKGEEDGDVFFSYNGVETTKGESVADKCKEWKEDGFEVEKDTRLEVDCFIMEEEDGEYVEGEMVMLSLPPTARKKFSGKYAMASRLYSNMGRNGEVVMKAEIGKSVKVGSRTFKPWLFGYVKP